VSALLLGRFEGRPLAAHAGVGHLLAGAIIEQSVEIGGVSLAATAGVMEVFGHWILAAGAQWLAT
jgi:hypothetical protein